MGKNKIGMILIIVLLVTLLVLFGVGFALLYKAMNKTDSGVENNSNVAVQQVVSMQDITPIPVGEPIITNLLEGPDGKDHIIKVDVTLGVNTSKETAKEAGELITLLQAQNSVIRDIIIDICASKTYEEVKNTNARSMLKEEILLELQEKFETNLIVDVYINEIFHQ